MRVPRRSSGLFRQRHQAAANVTGRFGRALSHAQQTTGTSQPGRSSSSTATCSGANCRRTPSTSSPGWKAYRTLAGPAPVKPRERSFGSNTPQPLPASSSRAHPLRSSAAIQGCVCGLFEPFSGSGCPPRDRGVGGRKTRAGEHHLPTGHVVGVGLPVLVTATPTRDWRPRNPHREALLPPKHAG